MIYPSGRSIKYTYDAVGRINSVSTIAAGKNSADMVVSEVQYHPFGGVAGFTYGNGQTHTQAQDLDGRPSGYVLGSSAYAIDYDDANQIKAIRNVNDASQITSYTWDGLGRLTGMTAPTSTSYGYSYDAVGNRTAATTSGASLMYGYKPNSNWLKEVGNTAQGFDANGSLEVSAAGTFTYDTKGRMNQHTGTAGMATRYGVDALGLRIRKVNDVSDVVYVHDEWGNMISENAADGTPLKEYIYLGKLPVAVVGQ